MLRRKSKNKFNDVIRRQPKNVDKQAELENKTIKHVAKKREVTQSDKKIINFKILLRLNPDLMSCIYKFLPLYKLPNVSRINKNSASAVKKVFTDNFDQNQLKHLKTKEGKVLYTDENGDKELKLNPKKYNRELSSASSAEKVLAIAAKSNYFSMFLSSAEKIKNLKHPHIIIKYISNFTNKKLMANFLNETNFQIKYQMFIFNITQMNIENIKILLKRPEFDFFLPLSQAGYTPDYSYMDEMWSEENLTEHFRFPTSNLMSYLTNFCGNERNERYYNAHKIYYNSTILSVAVERNN